MSVAGEPGGAERQVPLVLVSNRGPVTFDEHGQVQRGSGGVVTALTGLASHREAIWIASAMSDYDAEASRAHGGRSFTVRSPSGGDFQVRLVVSDAEAYDRFYNVVANPMLWFIQHYLWDLSNAPDIRREEIEAFEFGYNVVENPVHVHDLHATVLHTLGLDHEKLTFRYAGRDFRLTDVYGNVVKSIMA